jgi:methionine-rich copper-binding protein CopC
MKGLEGKPDLSQTPKISGVAQPTDWSFKDLEGNEKHPWEYHVDTTDPNCLADIDNTWFSAVPVPGADVTVPTVTTTPTNGATGVAATSNIVFTFSKPIAINTVNDSNIMLLKADGSVVAATLSLTSDNSVVTLHPSSNLAAGTYTAICSKNVTSTSGIALASNRVITFTV